MQVLSHALIPDPVIIIITTIMTRSMSKCMPTTQATPRT
jgi:hypothetical protein